MRSLFGERLTEIDSACAGGGPEAFTLFRELDDDLWAMLLSRHYETYRNILALLPETPRAELQRNWNGRSGLALIEQSKAFYVHVKSQLERHSGVALNDATVLDFGCGWGRLTRFFARDVAPGSLFGCDPVEEILDVCRRARVPAVLARSDFVPERIPFDDPVDLAFSFSVFTHISEAAADACISALHAGIKPGGLLVITVRPPAYLELDPKMSGALAELGPDPVRALAEPRYVFVPHPADPTHPQYVESEMTYGESVISLPWVRERWSDRFELVEIKVATEDIYQVALTLQRRD